jgi:hypothetical protein
MNDDDDAVDLRNDDEIRQKKRLIYVKRIPWL